MSEVVQDAFGLFVDWCKMAAFVAGGACLLAVIVGLSIGIAIG